MAIKKIENGGKMNVTMKKKIAAGVMLFVVLLGFAAMQMPGVVGEAYAALDTYVLKGKGGMGLAVVGTFWGWAIGVACPIAGVAVGL